MDVCVAAAAALAAAHERSILHRDVKPANLVRDRERIRLVDFGIALPLAEHVRLTRTGSLIGTPLYMAPEHLLGAPASAATDLYALGATLYEICCGQAPHDDADLAALVASARHGPPPLRVPPRLGPLPPDFEELVLRLLAPDPAHRPASAQDVLVSARAIRQRFETTSWIPGSRVLADFARVSSHDADCEGPALRRTESDRVPKPEATSGATSVRERGTWERLGVLRKKS